ncbi:MAG: hypothetical protein K2Q10_14030, partial [Rhodospirillales bacterium]|nr:hypothetical protein [Rhodospirillales bacterium]
VAGGRLVLRGLAEFREHLGGDLTVTLLAEPGHGMEVHAMEIPALEAAVRDLAERDGRRCA